MGGFKPFRRAAQAFRPTSKPQEPPPLQPQPSESDGSGASAALNREVTPPPATPRDEGPTPEQNFAIEEEKKRQAELQAEWTQAVDTLGIASRLMNAATTARKDAVDNAAPVIAQIVRTVVERVLLGTLQHDDEALVRVIREAAEALPADVIALRLNPQDLQRVQHLLPDTLAAVVEADDTLQGGCVAKTQRAEVDASIAAAIRAVDAMLAEWDESPSP